MKLKLIKFRKKIRGEKKKGALLIPWSTIDPTTKKIKEKGLAHWKEVDQVVEVPDQAGYEILRDYSDILEIEGATTKKTQAPANK